MNILIKTLTLINFKGVKKLTVDFNFITNIYGANASGMITIFDAFTWMLFGKDSNDRKDFNVKPLDQIGITTDRTVKIDKGIIVTEIETTNIREKKGGFIKGSVGMDKLKSGAEILITDSAGFKISVMLDTLTDKLTAKAESTGEKTTSTTKYTTTEYKDGREEKEKSGSSEEDKQVATSQEHRQKKNVQVEKKKLEPNDFSFMLWWIGIGLATCLIIWYIRKKRIIVTVIQK